MNYQNELAAARETAQKARQLVVSYAKNRHTLNVDYKGKHDLVTQADVESEKLILTRLKALFPDDHYMAEESASARQLKYRTWIIDPIDGTTNFTHGLSPHCVSIGLFEDGKPVVGVVLEVAGGEEFYAAKGMGAYRNEEPIKVSTNAQPKEYLIGTGFPYRDLGLVDAYLEVFKTLMAETQGVRRPGAASYDLCMVASGRYDGFYEYGLAPWDVAAGAAIILEAGGVINDWQNGDNWLFGNRFVAGNSACTRYLINVLQAHFSPDLLTV